VIALALVLALEMEFVETELVFALLVSLARTVDLLTSTLVGQFHLPPDLLWFVHCGLAMLKEYL
jgi:hypothetical protein